MSNQYIELNKLVKSPLNARKTVSEAASEELKASILAHGLMQNLVVVPAESGYQVNAGARRLAALKSLQSEGKLPDDHAVPCQVVTAEHALEMSLAENTVRAAMHPADEFEAFAELYKQGRTVGFIAERFGVTEKHVWQRLKLGKVTPELMAEYRAGEIDLECLMAFTITDDRERQLEAYHSLSEWDRSRPHSIRRALTATAVKSTDKLAQFVGVEDYQAAGGRVKADLFGEDVYLEDAALLNRLAGEKLDAEVERLRQEGWGWIEVGELDYSTRTKFERIEPVPLDAPADLVAELEAAEAEQTRIAELIDATDDDDELDNLYEQDRANDAVLEGINEKLESFVDFDPEQMKSAGCFVFIGYGGKLDVEKGLVRPEDKKAIARAACEDADDDLPAEKPKGVPESLRRDLEIYRLQAAQAEIAMHPAIVFDLLVFQVAREALASRPSSDGFDVHLTRGHHKPSAGGESLAAERLEAVKNGLPLKWLKQENADAQFLAFRELPEFQKHLLLAYGAALTLKSKLDTGKAPTAYDTALALTGANVADYWRPTRENYLGRITKDRLLSLGREMLGESWAARRKDSKKAQLVEQLHQAFEEPEVHGKTPEQVARLENWLPDGMAFGEMPEPEPTKKGKKAA